MSSKRLFVGVFILALLVGLVGSVSTAVAKGQAGIVGVAAKDGAGFNRSVQNASIVSPEQAGKKPTIPGKPIAGTCGAFGEPGQEKVFTPYGNTIDTYIYQRCGVVYSTYQSNNCGCRAGGWHYIDKCVKTKPVIINLPCHQSVVVWLRPQGLQQKQ